jgi:hypothetical protein
MTLLLLLLRFCCVLENLCYYLSNLLDGIGSEADVGVEAVDEGLLFFTLGTESVDITQDLLVKLPEPIYLLILVLFIFESLPGVILVFSEAMGVPDFFLLLPHYLCLILLLLE